MSENPNCPLHFQYDFWDLSLTWDTLVNSILFLSKGCWKVHDSMMPERPESEWAVSLKSYDLCLGATAASASHFIQICYFLTFTLNRKILHIHLTGLTNYALKKCKTSVMIIPNPDLFCLSVQNSCDLKQETPLK